MSFNSPGDKAGPLRYTQKYVYNIADCLGKGATASVHLGRNRMTGSQVAIKVFAGPESHHITQARLRETELLKAVSHRNVMQLLDCEKEVDSGQNVLVMPYCQCGSVYTLLEQPQNGLGFEEKEFLRFLSDITMGLHYLKEKKIIHRDIKPGNIMKGIEDDGSSVYILTDFGAARELEEEDETFMSIYGTEEYIHPDMFQRAVLRKPGQSQFDSSVDLWSLAVTLYHVATGTLPFQSYGGRKDSQKTYEIISGRNSGDISGIQKHPGGAVERSKQLPDTCYLSKGLRQLLEPILAGLFEPDSRVAMTFDQYFESVSDVINRKTVKVFFAQNGTNSIIYLRKTDSFVQIQERIASITDISPDRQILLLADTELRDIVERNEQIQTYPKAVQNTQLFLFEKENYDGQRLMLPNLLPPFPSLSVSSSLSSDASAARQCAAVACFIEWKLQEVKRLQLLLLEAKLYLRLYVQKIVQPIERVIPELEKELFITKKRTEHIQISQQNIHLFMTMLDLCAPDFTKGKDLKVAMQQFCVKDVNMEDIFNKTNNRYEEIKVYLSVLVQRLEESSTPGPADHLGCHEEDHCLTKVEHIKQGIQTVSTTFSKHKKYGELHPHEIFIHKVEREKLEDYCVKILSLFQDHCLRNLMTAHLAVNKQISNLLRHLTRVGKVESNIKCVVDCQGQINTKLNQVDERYRYVSKMLQSKMNVYMKTPGSVSTVVKGETIVSTEDIPGASASSQDDRTSLIQRLFDEVTLLGTARTELDCMLSSNTESLRELKRMLETTSRLSPTSFATDKKSVECTDRPDFNSEPGTS